MEDDDGCLAEVPCQFLTINTIHQKDEHNKEISFLLPFYTEKQKHTDHHSIPYKNGLPPKVYKSAIFASPTESNVEQELQTLKSLISLPSATIDTTCDRLRRLADPYTFVEEMLYMPSNQQALTQQRKTAEKELDRSLVLIDLCSAMQQSLAELKTSVQELRLALRKGDDAAVQLKIDSFVCMAKKAHKPMKKTTSKATAAECCRVVRLMGETREMAIYLLESVLRILPEQIGSSQNASKWSLVSKRFQKRKVVCEERQLRALELSIADLGYGVGILFRRLIQTRVALLNILSS